MALCVSDAREASWAGRPAAPLSWTLQDAWAARHARASSHLRTSPPSASEAPSPAPEPSAAAPGEQALPQRGWASSCAAVLAFVRDPAVPWDVRLAAWLLHAAGDRAGARGQLGGVQVGEAAARGVEDGRRTGEASGALREPAAALWGHCAALMPRLHELRSARLFARG